MGLIHRVEVRQAMARVAVREAAALALQAEYQAVLWRDSGAGGPAGPGVAKGAIPLLYNNDPLESKSRRLGGKHGL